MATLHHDHRGHAFMLLKGAPETILPLCLSDAAGEPVDHAAWEARMQAAATSGERLLALARRELPDASGMLTLDAIAPGFTLLGIVGMLDPPRPEAISAVAQCNSAADQIAAMVDARANAEPVRWHEYEADGERYRRDAERAQDARRVQWLHDGTGEWHAQPQAVIDQHAGRQPEPEQQQTQEQKKDLGRSM